MNLPLDQILLHAYRILSASTANEANASIEDRYTLLKMRTQRITDDALAILAIIEKLQESEVTK